MQPKKFRLGRQHVYTIRSIDSFYTLTNKLYSLHEDVTCLLMDVLCHSGCARGRIGSFLYVSFEDFMNKVL